MLKRDKEVLDLEGLIAAAREFISGYVLPRTDEESEYLVRFARGNFEPALLFGDEPMARAALVSPETR